MTFLVFFALKSLNLLDLFTEWGSKLYFGPKCLGSQQLPPKNGHHKFGVAGSWVNRWKFNPEKKQKWNQQKDQNQTKTLPHPYPPKNTGIFQETCFLFLFLVAFKDWIKLSSPETVWVKIYDRDSLGLDSFEKKTTPLGGLVWLVCVVFYFFKDGK